jgi:predicted secreted protein
MPEAINRFRLDSRWKENPMNASFGRAADAFIAPARRISTMLGSSLLLMLALLAPSGAGAQTPVEDRPASSRQINDVLTLDASVSSEIAPDLAVIVMAVTREGIDTAAMTQEVNQVLAKAVDEARSTPGAEVASGGFSTTPRYDNKGQRTGWQVRAELILKSRDFALLGKLVGKLSPMMDIAGNSFELSPALRRSEEAKMIDAVVAAFKEKAEAAARAFGYASYSIREVRLGDTNQGGMPRPMLQTRGMAAPAPMPIESGLMTLQLGVSGSVQMRK